MAEYRWNQLEVAAGYDASAPIVHPYYAAVQDAVMAAIPGRPALIVDIGGGSGRLLERCLERWPDCRAVLVDQSAPFLQLAGGRLARFGDRVSFHESRLQDGWERAVLQPPSAIVSTSAIHHLEPPEKRALYTRCAQLLAAGGVLVNGDEVRPVDEAAYRAVVEKWAAHMQHLAETGSVSAPMADALLKWRRRNVEQFGGPRVSGDDCHETLAVQLGYFREAGLVDVRVGWERELWAVMIGQKAA